jgi:hypothetical protein
MALIVFVAILEGSSRDDEEQGKDDNSRCDRGEQREELEDGKRKEVASINRVFSSKPSSLS